MEFFDNETVFKCNEYVMGPKRDSLYVVIPISIIYVIIFITGTVGNISTCIVIARNKAMHTATNYYLFSLAISDLVLLIMGLPQEIYFFWSRYPYIFGSTFCSLRGLFAETSGNATVLTITAFTVERYLAICHPFLSHTMSKLSRAIKLIVVIWILAVGLAIPVGMALRVVDEDQCPKCEVRESVIEQHAFEVSTCLFFFAPMTLITVLYILIALRLKSSRMMKTRISTNARIQSKSSRKVVKMLVAVVVAFFICWAPFHVQRLYSIHHVATLDEMMSHFYLKIYEVVTYISGILYYMSATINPILYNIMSMKFREAFKETFSRCCGIGHLHHGRPQRSYSALSRSNIRGPDSTDSGSHDPTERTNTSLAHKNSTESFNGSQLGGKRYKPSSIKRDLGLQEPAMKQKQKHNGMELQPLSALTSPNLQHHPTYLFVHVDNPTPTRVNKFLQFFECIAKKTLDDKRIPSFYSSPVREPNIPELQKTETFFSRDQFAKCNNFHKPCISNSSLKDIETGAIDDELTTYMKEIRRREMCS